MTNTEQGAGKTAEMIRALPIADALIVVPNAGMGRAVMRAIREVHGSATFDAATSTATINGIRTYRTVIVQTAVDLDKLLGARCPIVVEASWYFTKPVPDDQTVARMEALQRHSERFLVAA